MKGQIKSWWISKGARLINQRTVDLIGQGIGYVPIENLLTSEELSEIDSSELPDLIETMCDDGMRIKELVYSDGSRELRFFID